MGMRYHLCQHMEVLVEAQNTHRQRACLQLPTWIRGQTQTHRVTAAEAKGVHTSSNLAQTEKSPNAHMVYFCICVWQFTRSREPHNNKDYRQAYISRCERKQLSLHATTLHSPGGWVREREDCSAGQWPRDCC
jgi:hypothetical protein